MKNKIDNAMLLVQVILIFFGIFFAIFSLFLDNLFLVTNILMVILLFVMAYNNEKTFKRKNATLFYIIFGILLLIGAFING